MPDATFTRPDLTTFTRLDGLGLEVTGQLLDPDRSVLACRVVEPDDWCRRCGCQGVPECNTPRIGYFHPNFQLASSAAVRERGG